MFNGRTGMVNAKLTKCLVRRQPVGGLIIESATPHAIICIQLVDSSALEALPAALKGEARHPLVIFRKAFSEVPNEGRTRILCGSICAAGNGIKHRVIASAHI